MTASGLVRVRAHDRGRPGRRLSVEAMLRAMFDVENARDAVAAAPVDSPEHLHASRALAGALWRDRVPDADEGAERVVARLISLADARTLEVLISVLDRRGR